jgi:G3E family GTPase
VTPGAVSRLPVFVVTGFLGSGKSTLLRRILTCAELSDSAVIINELGEIGLDHELISHAVESTVVLPGGCVCCSIRTDIEQTLSKLFSAREAGAIPLFRRIIIETTGIAEPQPLLLTLHTSPVATSRLAKPQVITVFDGILGDSTLARHKEVTAQLVAAHVVVISKRDLGGKPDRAADISRLNPWAKVVHADLHKDDLRNLFTVPAPIAEFEFDAIASSLCEQTHEPTAGGHQVSTCCLSFERPLNWSAFGVWMTMLLHFHGARVLRVKGILNIEECAGPVFFHSAQHLVHPPEHRDAWPSSDRRSKLVFIVQGLDLQLLERSLRLVNALAGEKTGVPPGERYLPASAGGSMGGRPVRRPTTPRWIKG